MYCISHQEIKKFKRINHVRNLESILVGEMLQGTILALSGFLTA